MRISVYLHFIRKRFMSAMNLNRYFRWILCSGYRFICAEQFSSLPAIRTILRQAYYCAYIFHNPHLSSLQLETLEKKFAEIPFTMNGYNHNVDSSLPIYIYIYVCVGAVTQKFSIGGSAFAAFQAYTEEIIPFK